MPASASCGACKRCCRDPECPCAREAERERLRARAIASAKKKRARAAKGRARAAKRPRNGALESRASTAGSVADQRCEGPAASTVLVGRSVQVVAAAVGGRVDDGVVTGACVRCGLFRVAVARPAANGAGEARVECEWLPLHQMIRDGSARLRRCPPDTRAMVGQCDHGCALAQPPARALELARDRQLRAERAGMLGGARRVADGTCSGRPPRDAVFPRGA